MAVHSNPTQQITPEGFNPLRTDEGPYYNNLNRAPKNAYDYADRLNTAFSFSGSVSKVRPKYSSQVFSVYDIVHLLDGELIEATTTSMPKNDRFGIIVAELDSEGNYFICTFNPNFVFPSAVYASLPFASVAGTKLYLTSDGQLSTTTSTGGSGTNIGNTPLAIITGTETMFFAGTARLFS